MIDIFDNLLTILSSFKYINTKVVIRFEKQLHRKQSQIVICKSFHLQQRTEIISKSFYQTDSFRQKGKSD